MFNIILNPRSGEGKKKKLHRRAIERFRERKQEFRVFETERAGQATLLAHDLCEEGNGDVVVIGGDGTLHEVVNGFSNFDHVALGLIPAGTGMKIYRGLSAVEVKQQPAEPAPDASAQ